MREGGRGGVSEWKGRVCSEDERNGSERERWASGRRVNV